MKGTEMIWRSIIGASALILGLTACGNGDGGRAGKGPDCAAGDTACGNSCVDLLSDPRHCGGCGEACAPGELCVSGQCTTSCPEGQTACGSGCFDLSTSPHNCGSCGNACPAGQACADGSCVTACPAGQEACDGGCFDLDSSEEHCGTCGNACAPGMACIDGACTVPSCPAGFDACGSECVDLQTDRDHCGACGSACGTGELCIAGQCEIACAEGMLVCDGECRDPDTDFNHCGGCGNACGTNEICQNGSCVVSCGGFTDDLCNGSCTNFDFDPANCGGCGKACAEGEVCSNGRCAATCDGGLDLCGDGCTDVNIDPRNCGGCGIVCKAPPNAAAICDQGQCITLCPPGYADCNGDLGEASSDGCEVVLTSDVNNCGACGNVCPTPQDEGVAACGAGVCGVACAPGFADCDLDPSNGCEADLLNSTRSCGHCGFLCSSDEICRDGWCTIAPYADHCSNPAILVEGNNTIEWDSARADYITGFPSCAVTYPATGPDLVMRYDATFDGTIDVSITRPASDRWYLLYSEGVCEPGTGPRCIAESASTPFRVRVAVRNGQSYYFFLVDSTQSTGTLPSPLQVFVKEEPAGASCQVGKNGLIGTRAEIVGVNTTTSPSEYYVAVDPDPNGWVYVGYTTSLWRVSKIDGRTEDAEALFGLTNTNLGYAMAFHGSDIFVVNDDTAPTSASIQRIRPNGSGGYTKADAATFPTAPTDDFRGATAHGGRVYLITQESTRSTDTQIWSFNAEATTWPTNARLELSFGANAYHYCHGLAMDATYYYTYCAATTSTTSGFAVIRIHRTTGAITELATNEDGSTSNLAIAAADVNGDDQADYLYYRSDTPEVKYVCNPHGATPGVGTVLQFNYLGESSTFGLALDATSNSLWAWHDDIYSFIKIQ